MDCGTCEVVSPIVLESPTIVEVKLSITEKAKMMLEEAFGDDDDLSLLVGVSSGGCSGYVYDLQIVEYADTICQELNIGGIKVLIPNVVSHLLDGIEIDFEEKLMGGGFKINNPNAQSSCGCGESFS